MQPPPYGHDPAFGQQPQYGQQLPLGPPHGAPHPAGGGHQLGLPPQQQQHAARQPSPAAGGVPAGLSNLLSSLAQTGVLRGPGPRPQDDPALRTTELSAAFVKVNGWPARADDTRPRSALPQPACSCCACVVLRAAAAACPARPPASSTKDYRVATRLLPLLSAAWRLRLRAAGSRGRLPTTPPSGFGRGACHARPCLICLCKPGRRCAQPQVPLPREAAAAAGRRQPAAGGSAARVWGVGCGLRHRCRAAACCCPAAVQPSPHRTGPNHLAHASCSALGARGCSGRPRGVRSRPERPRQPGSAPSGPLIRFIGEPVSQ